MKFRTEVEIDASSKKIDYQSKVVFLGSCFTENIGRKFQQLRLLSMVNPFGVIYNPISVKNSLQLILENKKFTGADLFQYNEQWANFYFHSSFSHTDRDQALQKMNSSVSETNFFLKQADFLFITWGTSFCFEHEESRITVSNNHKLPSKEFRRYRLSVEEIVVEYRLMLRYLQEINPDLKIVFTVSPVRHLKDTAHGNQLSKSILLLAVDALISEFDQCDYFPAYEIFMDDLRDYRFYDSDLVHPSELGVSYVWDRFKEAYLDKQSIELGITVEKINRAMWHKVSNPDSDAHQKFLKRYLNDVLDLKEEFPYLDLDDALTYFKGAKQ